VDAILFSNKWLRFDFQGACLVWSFSFLLLFLAAALL
jgi:hypothetical protein